MSELRYTKRQAAAVRASRAAAEATRRAGLTHAEAVEEVRYSMQVQDGDLVEMWVAEPGGETKLITVDAYAANYYRTS
jgi:phage FluMu gp28-like protein